MNSPENASTDLREFLVNPQFAGFLDGSWQSEGFYRDSSTGLSTTPAILHYLILYHLYLALLGDRDPKHRLRAEALALHVAGRVREDGLLQEPDGGVGDHPAQACHVADGLGAFCHYGKRLRWNEEAVNQAREALIRLVERHPSIRRPNGIIGLSQQMRFELRAYYWAWRVTGLETYREACFALWRNGLHSYRNPIVHEGTLQQPSLHPDWTWNYACRFGTTTEYVSNTHTPVYYCDEPQGFAFVYHHGLKDGLFPSDSQWNDFCRGYFLGLIRNLSRAGHTASDVDGYGVHRAWYGGCLVETSPVEAAGMGMAVGLDAETCGWFRWYVGRYLDFVRRSPAFRETGLTEHCPYAHRNTTEKQFPPLMGSRLYAHLARAVYEYGLDEIQPIEPPPQASYAWWHNWVRASTPAYETSFVGTTSLGNIPTFRDPDLGCIHGGAPLSTLFVGNNLLYATSNDPMGLWHVELTDGKGLASRSCMTSFRDKAAMTVKAPDGRLLARDSFRDYAEPLNVPLTGKPIEVLWSKELPENGIRFFTHNTYLSDSFLTKWGFSFPAGLFMESAAFLLAIPVPMSPQIRLNGAWKPLFDGLRENNWPEAVRWRHGGSQVEVRLESEWKGASTHTLVKSVPIKERSPGGENSFCPFALFQLRLEADLTPYTNQMALTCDFACSSDRESRNQTS